MIREAAEAGNASSPRFTGGFFATADFCGAGRVSGCGIGAASVPAGTVAAALASAVEGCAGISALGAAGWVMGADFASAATGAEAGLRSLVFRLWAS